MRALSLSESSSRTNPVLDVFTIDGGLLADVYDLAFEVWRGPTRVFARASVSLTDDRVAVGHYAAAWTAPSDAEAVGAYQVRWFYKVTAEGPERRARTDFEVLSASADSSAFVLASVASVRAILPPASPSEAPLSDEFLQGALVEATAIVERATGVLFGARPLVARYDGRGTPSVFLWWPVVALRAATVGGYAISAADLIVANNHIARGQLVPDDRQSPRVTRRCGAWAKGIQNVELDGVFGYTTPDLTVPSDVQQAAGFVALRYAGLTSDEILDGLRLSAIKSETTRDQSVTYGSAAESLLRARPRNGSTGDQVADSILARYKPPLRLGSA